MHKNENRESLNEQIQGLSSLVAVLILKFGNLLGFSDPSL